MFIHLHKFISIYLYLINRYIFSSFFNYDITIDYIDIAEDILSFRWYFNVQIIRNLWSFIIYKQEMIYYTCLMHYSFINVSTVTGIFSPGKFPPQGSTPVVSPLEHSPHEQCAWKQRCLALREICRWREPVPTRVANPIASEASYKPEQRQGGKRRGELPWAEVS